MSEVAEPKSALDQAIEESMGGDDTGSADQPTQTGPIGPPAKPAPQEEQGGGAEVVTMAKHGKPALATERPQPKPEEVAAQIEPHKEFMPDLNNDQARRGAQRQAGSRVGYGETVNPWYLVSSNDGVTVQVMSVGGDDSLLMIETPIGVTETLLLNRKFGACHNSKGELDGTHEMYPAGNTKPMHLSQPEVRRMGVPRPGHRITG